MHDSPATANRMPEPTSSPLDYQRLPSRKRAKWIRSLVLLLIAAAAVTAIHHRNAIASHIRVRVLARQCARWQAPADAVAFCCFAEEAEELIKQQPETFRNFSGAAAREVPPWRDLRPTIIGLTPIPPPAVLFLHVRQAAAGAPPRLVVVEASSFAPSGHPFPTEPIRSIVVFPGGPLEAPQLKLSAPVLMDPRTIEWLDFAGFYRDGPTFLAGQPDPADPSHFTIGWVIAGLHETLDGWLLPDDRVRLTLRDPNGLRTRMRPHAGINAVPGDRETDRR